MATEDPTPTEVEIWKNAVGFNGYQVSTLGRIRSMRRRTCKILRARPLPLGYVQIGLFRDDGSRKPTFLHRLILMTFVGPAPEGKPHVNHIDFNRSNNRLSNLEWISRAENQRHTARAGRMARGERNSGAKLNREQIATIRDLRASGRSQQSIADEFGISQTQTSRIVRRDSWRHVA